MSAWDETVWALSRCEVEGCEEEGTEELDNRYLCPSCYTARMTRTINVPDDTHQRESYA